MASGRESSFFKTIGSRDEKFDVGFENKIMTSIE
jgi:hypothetical protein